MANKYQVACKFGGNTEPISWADIEDRPFGENKTLIMPDTVVNMTDVSSAYVEASSGKIDPADWIKLIVGESYQVVLDGESCICTASYNSSLECVELSFEINNRSGTIHNTSTGYSISIYDGGNYTCTLSIFLVSLQTIDSEFLPKATAVSDAAGETVTGTEFNALLTALREAGYLAT